MRAHVLSDIHFEHMQKEEGEGFFRQLEEVQKKDPAELVILAGDICQIGRHEAFWKSKVAQLISGYKKALYVPGNHEYYNYSFLDGDRFFEGVDHDPNFHNFVQLDHGPYEFGGIRFVGNTMWFPDTSQPRWNKRTINDFNVIRQFEPEVYQRHQEFLLKVMASLQLNDVVITHHLPLPESIDAQYKGSPLNPFFMADVSAHLYEPTLPKLWIHGHTHTPCDYKYQVGTSEMRVYCNPHGYPGEHENARYWDRVGIDIRCSAVVPSDLTRRTQETSP